MSLDNAFAMGDHSAIFNSVSELPEAAKNRLLRAFAPLLQKEIDALDEGEREEFVDNCLLSDQEVQKIIDDIDMVINDKRGIVEELRSEIESLKSSGELEAADGKLQSDAEFQLESLEKEVASVQYDVASLLQRREAKVKRIGMKIADLSD